MQTTIFSVAIVTIERSSVAGIVRGCVAEGVVVVCVVFVAVVVVVVFVVVVKVVIVVVVVVVVVVTVVVVRIVEVVDSMSLKIVVMFFSVSVNLSTLNTADKAILIGKLGTLNNIDVTRGAIEMVMLLFCGKGAMGSGILIDSVRRLEGEVGDSGVGR